MASEVGIANAALRLIGENTITSFTDGSPEANFIADRYEEVRDSLLRSHNWNFAVKRRKLAQLSASPAFGWDYQYQLPSDWLRTVSVHDNDAGVGALNYREENGKLLTNAPEVYLRYVARVTDPNLMPPDFREALAYRLAVEGAITLVQSTTVWDRMERRATEMIKRARSSDALGDHPEPLQQGSWITRRQSIRR